MALRTPLYDEHLKLGGRIVDFGGWDLPVQYSGLSQEHLACRQKAGLFDVSHMGEIKVTGAKATEYLNSLVTNDIRRLSVGQAQYNILCDSNGGCVDDIIVHKFSNEEYFICVNASNTEKDYNWFVKHITPGIEVQNQSSQYGQIALQGPHAAAILKESTGIDFSGLKYYHFETKTLLGQKSIVARTGYTGEDGFEIYFPWNHTTEMWNLLLKTGLSKGLVPCGLGARDTLRTEMKFPLYGHEISDTINPLEAGLGWVVKLDKENFVGKEALLKAKEKGITRRLVGLVSKGKAIPRQGYEVYHQNKKIGLVTSGTMSPSLRVGIAIALVDIPYDSFGQVLDIKIRDQFCAHEVCKTPFYVRQN